MANKSPVLDDKTALSRAITALRQIQQEAEQSIGLDSDNMLDGLRCIEKSATTALKQIRR
jgi:hypothetical protein